MDRLYDFFSFDYSTHLPSAYSESVRATRSVLKESILAWIVGHEIGHAVLHKQAVLGSGQSMHFSYVYNHFEREADEFFAKHLAKSERLLGAVNAGTIGEFIEQQYRELIRTEYSGIEEDMIQTRYAPTVLPITVEITPGDVPLIIRALNINKAIIDADVYLDHTGYFSIEMSNITLLTPTWVKASKLIDVHDSCPVYRHFDRELCLYKEFTTMIRIIGATSAILAFLVFIFLSYFLNIQRVGLGFSGSSFPWLAFVATCAAMFVGIFFGSLYRQLTGRRGNIKIGSEAASVLHSATFWQAICVSPLVFLGLYAITGGIPGDVPSLLLSFQNGFFWENVFKRLNAPEVE